MDYLAPVFDALKDGASLLIDQAMPIGVAYVSYLVYRLRSEIFSGVPAVFRAFVVAAFDAAVAPMIQKYVLLAEAHGKRLAAEGLDYLEVRAAKVLKVKELIAKLQSWTPDWLLSDARVEALVEAALVELGMVAVEKVKATVKIVEGNIAEIPAPPATE